MSIQNDYFDTQDNPLDHVEEVLSAHNWSFSRITDEELMVQVAGKNCNYDLFFIWQDNMNALQFCAQYNFVIPQERMDKAAYLLMNINRNLWLGHFEIADDNRLPSFRHTCLYRGIQRTGGGSDLEDLMDVALAQCESYYAAFYLLAHDDYADDQNMALALMETMGES
jgi:hypothetical protein